MGLLNAGGLLGVSNPFTSLPTTLVEVVVVGGGGGTSYIKNNNNAGGGGGAGGYRNISNLSVTPGTTYTVTVGSGGKLGANGSSSSFLTVTASGGGRAGGINYCGSVCGNSNSVNQNSMPGGSGAGNYGGLAQCGATTAGSCCTYYSKGRKGNIGSFCPPEGHAGAGAWQNGGPGGGGGGAGSVGLFGGQGNCYVCRYVTQGLGGLGGAGIVNTLSPVPKSLAGGGTGGSSNYAQPAYWPVMGNNSGGGWGGYGENGGCSNLYSGGPGAAGTGSGAGGPGGSASTCYTERGNVGGSGTVILRYSSQAAPPSNTINAMVSYTPGYQIYTWTSNGSITF
jgi:hypothetical protein